MNHNVQPHHTLFVALADGSCYFVPTATGMNPSVVDMLINGKSRFSVHLFEPKGGAYLYAINAHTRIMRTIYDGSVITETWDNHNYEWIPS